VGADVLAGERFAGLGGENEAVLTPKTTCLVYISPNWRSRWLLRASSAI
jgi:hypothetical protein